MNDITFLTTNNVKLSHAKYLGRNWDVNIIQHKLLHYGVGYEEPRLFDREKLLEESVKDAIIRWKKNISESENRFYFLEDTSVVIHALSEEGKEVPGVDIKYWMQENTFSQVDSVLKLKGNNRQVTVNSHVVLVLTKDLKEKYGKDYIIFKSKSEGSLVESEKKFETNILYPWLDNITFNKWFVPEGEEVPISTLPIEKADKYDFRKDAFEKMFSFLEENKKIYKKRAKEIQSRFLSNPIFIISGPTCAGKTTIGKFLLGKYGFYHIEASDFMSKEFLETHGLKPKFDIGEFAKKVLQKKPFIVVDNIFQYIEDVSNIDSIAITGFRTPSEIEYFIKNSPYRGEFRIVYINAEYELRYERWLTRNREIGNISREKFDLANNLQREMGVHKIEDMTDISVVDNNKTFNDYYESFKNRFLRKVSEDTEYNNLIIESFMPKKLEDAILFSLAIDYRNNNQEFLSTTEISRKINEIFVNLQVEKHKDNVSRYFNQRIYPFYEVKNIDDKIKYRLSPTGYSFVISLLKKRYNEKE